MKRIVVLIISLAILGTACEGSVFALEVGNCFNDPDSFEEVSRVEMVDCTEPHDNEVYNTWDMFQGEFPGDEITGNQAQQRCTELFAAYVGRDTATSSLAVGSLFPTAESWKRDDREVVCFLYDMRLAKLTGSARNSAL